MAAGKKYIEFQEQEQTGITKRFKIINTKYGVCLGSILWYSGWRRYCFFPVGSTIFDSSCMKDICEFIDGLMEERKGSKYAS